MQILRKVCIYLLLLRTCLLGLSNSTNLSTRISRSSNTPQDLLLNHKSMVIRHPWVSMTILSSKDTLPHHQDRHLQCRFTTKGIRTVSSISSILHQDQRNNQAMEHHICKISINGARGNQRTEHRLININSSTYHRASLSIVQRSRSLLLRKDTILVVGLSLNMVSLKPGLRANISVVGLAQCCRVSSRMSPRNSILTPLRFRMPPYHITKEFKRRSHQSHHCSIVKA